MWVLSAARAVANAGGNGVGGASVGCKCSMRVGVGGVLLDSVLSLSVVPIPGAGFKIM